MVPKSVLLILSVWFCLALAIGLGGWFEKASAPFVAATVWTLTALALLCCWKIPACREWALTVDLRWLVALHLTRFVGLYFLYLSSHGELPFGWAVPAGAGDTAVASMAIAVLVLSNVRKAKMLLVIWNTIGLTDILFVVVSALQFGLKDWQSMHALREFPLCLLPTFFVPIIIASHILIYFRFGYRTSKAAAV